MTDHTTIPRALAESWLNTLCYAKRSMGYDSILERAIVEIRAELANPPTPAWHDAPTEPGQWAWRSALTGERYFTEITTAFAGSAHTGRWYGPIPQEGKKS